MKSVEDDGDHDISEILTASLWGRSHEGQTRPREVSASPVVWRQVKEGSRNTHGASAPRGLWTPSLASCSPPSPPAVLQDGMGL